MISPGLMESLLALNVRNARVRVKYSQRYYYHGTLSLLGLVCQESSTALTRVAANFGFVYFTEGDC